MTLTQKIEFLWNKALTDAMGAGHADPFSYAAEKVSSLSSTLRAVERQQTYGALPRHSNQAGFRQAAARRAR
jgi:hypothetical protein